MIRRIAALAVVGTLVLVGFAWAAQHGTYSGMSTLTISGSTATHPFSLKVSHGKVVDVSLLAGSNCAALDGTAGLKSKFTIKHNRFSGTLRFKGGSSVKITGRFSTTRVTGSFTGKAIGGEHTTCSVPKNTFTATHSS